MNRVIDSANAVNGGVHFVKISGEYSPGYAYGNVKVHKPGKPLRPIISQIHTPTYSLAKRLNTLLKPYMPVQYSLDSVEEFLDVLRAKTPQGDIASIDVESLFTNVPVEDTIKIILDEVYDKRSNNLPPLKLSRAILEKLLRACTTECPFRGPDGKMYVQKEGVAMGSPLGPLFANFYMCFIENKTLSETSPAPSTYCRYVDDIFVEVQDGEHLQKVIAGLEANSVLRFTSENSIDSTLAFLDVCVTVEEGKFTTSVFRKPTNTGQVMNAKSECPEKYKKSVIKAFVKRTIKVSSSYKLMHSEFTRVRQILVNNGYSNSEIDAEIETQLKRYTDRHDAACDGTQKENHLTLYYRNFMNTSYKVDETVIKHIIKKNVKCVQEDQKLNLVVFYQSKKTRNFIMKNNMSYKREKLKCTNVVYQFICPHEDCRLRKETYIGVTTTSLSRRLTMHLRDGAPKEHMQQQHNTTLTRQHLTENTTIITSCTDKRKLAVLESLHIHEKRPTLNKQVQQYSSLLLWGNSSQ